MKGFLSKLRRKLAGSNDTTVHPDLDPVIDSELSEVEPLPAVEQAKPNSETTKSASDPEDLIRDGFHPDLYVFGSEVHDPVTRDDVYDENPIRNGPVPLSCRPKCSFKPLSVRRRRGFSSPVLSVSDADYRTR